MTTLKAEGSSPPHPTGSQMRPPRLTEEDRRSSGIWSDVGTWTQAGLILIHHAFPLSSPEPAFPPLIRRAREGMGSPVDFINWPLQVLLSASLVPQWWGIRLLVRETWAPSLGWDGPLEEGTATCSSIPACRIPWTEEPGLLWGQSRGRKESDTTG